VQFEDPSTLGRFLGIVEIDPIDGADEPHAEREGIGGIAVHIAARLLGPAESSQVVVTKTVRDLVTGTDLAFRPLGAVSLRGVPGEWELFEARTSDQG